MLVVQLALPPSHKTRRLERSAHERSVYFSIPSCLFISCQSSLLPAVISGPANEQVRQCQRVVWLVTKLFSPSGNDRVAAIHQSPQEWKTPRRRPSVESRASKEADEISLLLSIDCGEARGWHALHPTPQHTPRGSSTIILLPPRPLGVPSKLSFLMHSGYLS